MASANPTWLPAKSIVVKKEARTRSGDITKVGYHRHRSAEPAARADRGGGCVGL